MSVWVSELVIHLSDAQIEHYLGFVYKRISGYRSSRFSKFLIFIELFECIAIAVSFPLFSILYFNTLFFFIYILCIIIIIIMILCPSCTGSNKVFAALLDRCLARKVAPIVRMVARRGSSVSWAALIPQKEELDEKNCQISPPGFYACHLPFAGVFFFFSVIVNGSCRKNNNLF